MLNYIAYQLDSKTQTGIFNLNRNILCIFFPVSLFHRDLNLFLYIAYMVLFT